MNKTQEVTNRLKNEKEKFNGCFRGTNGAMVKKEVAIKNGWRIEVEGKGKPTSKYWQHRIKCIAVKVEATDKMVEKLLKAEDGRAEKKAKAESKKALAAEKRKERELERELKKQQAEAELKAEQEELEELRSKLRANGIDEEDLPTRSYGKAKDLQCPYNQTRRSGYLCIWLVLADTPDEWVAWDKLEKEALAIFEEKWPEYLATNYPDGYDIRRQVGVMDRHPYNKPLESIGQRVVRSVSKGVMLISDTKGESYEAFKARNRGKKVEAQLPPTATAPAEESKEEKVNA